MIIHLDTDNPKPIEQKVQELILKKLYIKVKDELIFIDKEEFIKLVLLDIIALAINDSDIEKAIQFRIKQKEKYKKVKEITRNELEEASVEFEVEIEAYQTYLRDLHDKITDDEIYMDVLSILNSEHELLESKLHELMMESLGFKLSEAEAAARGVDRERELDNFANQVKLIASYDTINEAVDAAYDEFENYPKKHLVTKESIKKEFERFTPLAKDEINAYKLALNMESQNAEFPMILAMVKQLLNLEE